MVRWFCLIIGMHLGFSTWAQAPKIITKTELTPSRGYVGEPRRLSITVLTETFFTAPVSITNLKIEGAFLVPRQNTSTTQREGGATYAGVIVNFYVLPYEEGTLEIPSVSFTTASPPPGDFRGREVEVTTRAASFKVNPVPPNMDSEQWVVANNLTIRENWDRPLRDLKVGDVITQTLTFSASNTLSEFIPEVEWPELEGVSIYAQQPQLSNTINKDFISGRRVERAAYLLEDTGSVTLPEWTFQFYHPGRRSFVGRTIDARTFTVSPNEDLAMVASMKDSLSAYLNAGGLEEVGISKLSVSRELLMALFVLAVVLWMIARWRLFHRTRRFLRDRRLRYEQSEPFCFKQLLHEVRGGDAGDALGAIYRYLDQVRPQGYDHTLSSAVEGTPLEHGLAKVMEILYQQEDRKSIEFHHIRQQLQVLRPRGADLRATNSDWSLNP